jgi:hypothetical protein
VLSLVKISLTHVHSCEVCTNVNKINIISVTTYCPLWYMKMYKLICKDPTVCQYGVTHSATVCYCI